MQLKNYKQAKKLEKRQNRLRRVIREVGELDIPAVAKSEILALLEQQVQGAEEDFDLLVQEVVSG